MGQKQKTEREKERREKERPKVGNNNGRLQIATPPRVAHAKPPGPAGIPSSYPSNDGPSNEEVCGVVLGKPN